MSCAHDYAFVDGGDRAFSVDASAVKYGPGVIREVGDDAVANGMTRVMLVTDPVVARLEPVALTREALTKAGVQVVVYDGVVVEPTDESFLAASRFAGRGRFDGYVAVGGGSAIDTAKAANLYATYPADFLDYVNPPVGLGRPVPGPLKPLIAVPTTAGTGAECTPIAIFDYTPTRAKTGIVSRRIRPTLGVVDPDCTRTLPPAVVASSGFDVLCHAVESYTALPYTRRARPAEPRLRPASQGANPFSDIACREAIVLTGRYMARAVGDPRDLEARERMMFAATLAGIGFGNAGCHVPHAMSYSVSGLVRDFRPEGYPDAPIIPHGMSVILNAPAVFRFTAAACPERHLEAARLVGADVRGAGPEDAGEVLARAVLDLMKATGMPDGLAAVGYTADDVEALTRGALLQQRLLRNAPCDVGEDVVRALYRSALRYW